GMRRCFFFQAEDGIRVRNVTGVQTCALPILFQPYSSAPLALYAAKLVSYSQGFDEIAKGADEYGWNITLGDMAAIWREGCIIRRSEERRVGKGWRVATSAHAARQTLRAARRA